MGTYVPPQSFNTRHRPDHTSGPQSPLSVVHIHLAGRAYQGATMALAIILSRTQISVASPGVTVEAHIANGLSPLTVMCLVRDLLAV
ncbi:hypothetical protein D3C71_1617350 [compost metagenome]